MMRLLSLAAAKGEIKKIELNISIEVAGYLQNNNRASITRLEDESDKKIIVNADPVCTADGYSITCYNDRESVVKF